jgi:transposase, IS30 family
MIGALMRYNHLTQDDRYNIYLGLKMGKKYKEIAFEIGRSESTISREIARNSGKKNYRPKQANEMAKERLKTKPKSIKMVPEVVLLIREMILKDWSPEQVSGRLFKDKKIKISPETIYQYILVDKALGGDLYTHLRCQKKNRKRYGTKASDKRGQIKNKKSIDIRPKIVDLKLRKGDWEGDLVIGKDHKSALVTLVDRKTKKVKIGLVNSKNARPVAEVIIELLKGEICHTLTFDNGKEFAEHEFIKENTNVDVFFAHPYSSWERGCNENTNGLIRQYFSKGSCFLHLTNEDVKRVENILNNRPRKSLKYRTPNECYK